MHITPEHISLDRLPGDKIAAIAQAAAIFVDNGCTEEPFRYGLIAREATGTTYFGHGIALPRGVAQTERHILRNSLAVIRTEEGGIPWGPQAERAELVIAVAAPDDACQRFAQHLARLVENPEHLAVLKNSQDPQAIIQLLAFDAPEAPAPAAPAPPAHTQPPQTPLPTNRETAPHKSSKIAWYIGAALALALLLYLLTR